MFFRKGTIVRGTNSCRQRVGDEACDGFGFADAFDFKAVFHGHVLEVRVAAKVQLVSFINDDAAVKAKPNEVSVQNGGADLAFDVVAQALANLLSRISLATLLRSRSR